MTWETVIFWGLTGVLAGGIVGHMRGAMGMGMLLGMFLGPLIGPIAVMLLTLNGNDADPRRIIPPELLDPPEQQP